ncbi:MAG: hydrogenase maturation protease [Polyangiaceae bacterium]
MLDALPHAEVRAAPEGPELIILGLGADHAGDDAIGLEVARALAARGAPARPCADASMLLALLVDGEALVLVDAYQSDEPAGHVRELALGELETRAQPVSSHGLGVAEALAMARALGLDLALTNVRIAGVSLGPTPNVAPGAPLSPALAAAFEPLAALALELTRRP